MLFFELGYHVSVCVCVFVCLFDRVSFGCFVVFCIFVFWFVLFCLLFGWFVVVAVWLVAVRAIAFVLCAGLFVCLICSV